MSSQVSLVFCLSSAHQVAVAEVGKNYKTKEKNNNEHGLTGSLQLCDFIFYLDCA